MNKPPVAPRRPARRDEPVPAGGSLQVVDTTGGAALRVRVSPRAGNTRLAGVRQGALVVRLAAAPVDGAANEALIRCLADVLGVPRRSVELISGVRSRDKRVRIAGLHAARVKDRLGEAVPTD